MKKSFLPIILTLLLVGLLVYQIDLSKAGRAFLSLSLPMVGKGLSLYFGYLLFITWRFYLLIHSRKISITHLAPVTSVHNMYNRLLPFRSGEVTYIYLLRKLKGLPAAEGVSTLLIARIFDYLTISLYFLIGVGMTYQQQSPLLKKISLIMSFFLALAVILLVFVGFLGEKTLSVAKKIACRFELDRKPPVGKILGKLEELVLSLKTISKGKTYALSLFSSVLVWGCMFSLCFLLMREFGIELSFFSVVIGSTFSILANVLPVNGLAGFGTMEASWTVGYMLMGVSKQAAIASAFYVHIFVLAGAVIYGIIGLLFTKRIAA
ncbi:MAG: lysylphosphatidylglycerol synthase transmembrane domain-containing protein [bacterium]